MACETPSNSVRVFSGVSFSNVGGGGLNDAPEGGAELDVQGDAAFAVENNGADLFFPVPVAVFFAVWVLLSVESEEGGRDGWIGTVGDRGIGNG